MSHGIYFPPKILELENAEICHVIYPIIDSDLLLKMCASCDHGVIKWCYLEVNLTKSKKLLEEHWVKCS